MADKKINQTDWPLTMTEATHIATLPAWVGSDESIAREYGVSIELIAEIRKTKSYHGVRL